MSTHPSVERDSLAGSSSSRVRSNAGRRDRENTQPQYRKRKRDPDIESEIEEAREAKERAECTDHKKIRDDITNRIEELILQLNPSLDQRKAAVVARHLDSKLFASSATFEKYSDPHSLDERLRSLARGIGLQIRRQQHKRQESVGGSTGITGAPSANGGGGGGGAAYSEERKELLRKRVGDELYAEISRLVAEVEEIRRTNGAWTWIAQKAAASASVAASSSSSSSSGSSLHQRASLSMPPGLTSIYFNTRLVEAHRALTTRSTASLQAEERVDRVAWEDLAAEARSNVEAFREMEDEARSMQTCGLKRASCAFAW